LDAEFLEVGFQPYDDLYFRETIEPFPYDLEVTEIGEGSGNRHKDSDFQGGSQPISTKCHDLTQALGMICLDIKGRHRTVKAQQDNKQFQITWNCWTFPPNFWEARCELTITQRKGTYRAWWNNRSYSDCGNSDETENKTGGNINLLTALEVKNGASAKKAILKAVGDQGFQLLFAVCGLPHIRACSCGCGPKKKKACGYTLFGNLG
jgi:hypothetical protein